MRIFSGLYTVGKKMGQGADGSVWEVVNKSNQKKMAVKVVKLESISTYDMYTTHFLLEARIMMDLVDVDGVPHIEHFFRGTPTFPGAEIKDSFVFTMTRPEKVHDTLDVSTILNKMTLRNIFIKLAHALQGVDKKGISHMDLHVGNVIVSKDFSEVMLLDFGRAQYKNMPFSPILLERMFTWDLAPPELRDDGNLQYDPCTTWLFGKMMYMKYVRDHNMKTIYTDVQNDNTLPPLLKDLLNRVFQPLEKRITLQEMFKHKYFDPNVKENYDSCGGIVITTKEERQEAARLAARQAQQQARRQAAVPRIPPRRT